MIFFTADTHFGHRNILALCNRPFATIEEMNETMIDRWNDRVSGADTVYAEHTGIIGTSKKSKVDNNDE